MSLLVKVLINLAGGDQFDEYLGPPLPPETLGFSRIEGATAEPGAGAGQPGFRSSVVGVR
jgi:hypothetical protein